MSALKKLGSFVELDGNNPYKQGKNIFKAKKLTPKIPSIVSFYFVCCFCFIFPIDFYVRNRSLVPMSEYINNLKSVSKIGILP